MNLALISDIQCAHCSRPVRVYLVYLFVCHWYIRFAVIETGLVCAFYFYSSSQYWSYRNVYFLIVSCSNCVLIYTPNSRRYVYRFLSFAFFCLRFWIRGFGFAVWHFLFFVTRSLTYANWIRWLNDKPYHIIIIDSNLTPLLIAHRSFRFCFRLTKSIIHRSDPIHSKIKKRFSLFSDEIFWCWWVWRSLSRFLNYRISISYLFHKIVWCDDVHHIN